MGNHNGMIIEKFVVATIVNVSCLNVFAFIRMWTWVRVCMRAMYNKLLRQTFLQSFTLLICAKAPCFVGDSTALCETRRVKARRVIPSHSVIVECSRPRGFPSPNHAAFNRQCWTCLSDRNLSLLQQWVPAPHARNTTDPARDVNGFIFQ